MGGISPACPYYTRLFRFVTEEGEDVKNVMTDEDACPKNWMFVYQPLLYTGEEEIAKFRIQGHHQWATPNFVSLEYSYYCQFCLRKVS